MTESDVWFVGRGELRVRLGQRILVIEGERLVPEAGSAFWALPPTAWRWEDGAELAPEERSEVINAARARARACGIDLDIDPNPAPHSTPAKAPPGLLTFKGFEQLVFEGPRGTVSIPGHLRFVGAVPHFAIQAGVPWVWSEGQALSVSQLIAVRGELLELAASRGVVIEGA